MKAKKLLPSVSIQFPYSFHYQGVWILTCNVLFKYWQISSEKIEENTYLFQSGNFLAFASASEDFLFFLFSGSPNKTNSSSFLDIGLSASLSWAVALTAALRWGT